MRAGVCMWVRERSGGRILKCAFQLDLGCGELHPPYAFPATLLPKKKIGRIMAKPEENLSCRLIFEGSTSVFSLMLELDQLLRANLVLEIKPAIPKTGSAPPNARVGQLKDAVLESWLMIMCL